MDSPSQSASAGGGGRRSPDAARDERRSRPPQTHDGVLSGGQPAVLTLDQIRVTGSSNEYTDGPTAPPEPRPPGAAVTSPGSETLEERLSEPPPPSGAEDSLSSIRTSVGSASSAQRLLATPTIRTQPKRGAELGSEELKPLSGEPRPLATAPGSGGSKSHGVHGKCEDCGRCCCAECRRPRSLPSCWMCGRRCVCSAASAAEYATCVCCLKGLFYHCSSDDEDTCADKPFSCSQPRCGARWAAAALLAAIFPCLLCYLPAKGCVAVCQSCYDRVTRPGCRC